MKLKQGSLLTPTPRRASWVPRVCTELAPASWKDPFCCKKGDCTNNRLFRYSANQTKLAPTVHQSHLCQVSIFLSYDVRAPSIALHLTNQVRGRLHRGLGARIGGMDKNHKQIEVQIYWIETTRKGVIKAAALACLSSISAFIILHFLKTQKKTEKWHFSWCFPYYTILLLTGRNVTNCTVS